MSAAKVCPKCGQARTPHERVPAWQCPSCGIAYQKYGQYVEKSRTLVRSPRAGEAAPPVSLDGSVWALLVANLLAAVVAVTQRWNLAELVAVYLVQSVVICVAYAARIASLERFTPGTILLGGRPVPATPEGRRQAVLGVLTFGCFVFGIYYVFLVLGHPGPLFSGVWFWVAAAVFAANHAWSYHYNRALDRRGAPDIGNMMLTPFIRVLPMHAVLGAGYLVAPSTQGVILFAVLKTLADVAMHIVEHMRLRRLP